MVSWIAANAWFFHLVVVKTFLFCILNSFVLKYLVYCSKLNIFYSSSPAVCDILYIYITIILYIHSFNSTHLSYSNLTLSVIVIHKQFLRLLLLIDHWYHHGRMPQNFSPRFLILPKWSSWPSFYEDHHGTALQPCWEF